MEESFEDKLNKVDLLEIHDDIADIELSPDELTQLVSVFTCKVDLRMGNVVYAVEKKYKHKLENYNGSHRLKWLRLNLKKIIPNPEEKIQKWQQRNLKSIKYEWIKRKIAALEYFTDDQLVYRSDMQFSQRLSMIRNTRLSEFSEASNNPSNGGNTTAESVQTVIASQIRNTEESHPGPSFPSDVFENISISDSSGEPSLCSADGVLYRGNEAEALVKITEQSTQTHVPKQISQGVCGQPPKPLMGESEELSSQEYDYNDFSQDMLVTSTQEFG